MSIASKVLCTLTVASLAWPISHLHAQPAGGIIQPKDKDTAPPPISLEELEQRVGGRTMLGLKLENAALEEVAALMSRSSGLDIREQPMPPLPPIADGQPVPFPLPLPLRYSFEAPEQPFWGAMFAWKRAARQADLVAFKAAHAKPPVLSPDGHPVPPAFERTPLVSLEPRKAQGSYWLLPSLNMPDGPVSATWPLLVLATNIQRAQDAEFASDLLEAPVAREKVTGKKEAAAVDENDVMWNDRMTLTLQVFFDPKLKVQPVTCDLQEAVDDLGNDLLPARDSVLRGSSGFSYSNVSAATPVPISLQPRPGMGRRLKLRGTMRFALPMRYEKWEITDLNTLAQRQVSVDGGAYQISFEGMEKTNAGWQAKFSVYGEGNHIRQLPFIRKTSAGMRNFSLSSVSRESSGLDLGFDFLQFADEAGRTFIVSDVSGDSYITGKVRPSQPTLSPPLSGMDIWTYSDKKTVQFVPADPAANKIGKASNDAKNEAETDRAAHGVNGGVDVANQKLPHIIVNIPAEKREVIVPFEFTDLPLPPS